VALELPRFRGRLSAWDQGICVTGSRSPATTARMIRMPVAPVGYDVMQLQVHLHSAFCICWMCEAAQSSSRSRWRR
jgi:hypothetical protein